MAQLERPHFSTVGVVSDVGTLALVSNFFKDLDCLLLLIIVCVSRALFILGSFFKNVMLWLMMWYASVFLGLYFEI